MAKTLAQKIAALNPTQQAKYYSGAYGTGEAGIANVLANTSLAGQAGDVPQIDLSTGTWVGNKPLGPKDINLTPDYTPPPAEEEEDEEDYPPGWTKDANGNWVEVPTTDPNAPTAKETSQLRAQLRAWIQSNFLPEQVEPAMAFIENALTSGDPYDKIILDLQETQFFKDAYPELAARKLRGLGNVSLEYIRGYRSDAKRIAKSLHGTQISDQQIANLIANDVSIGEWADRLTTYKKVQTMGGPVRALFEVAIGHSLTDQELHEWFDGTLPGKEGLDELYNDARVKGMPVLFGLKPRSQAEADAYKMLGLDPDEVIERFRKVGQNASRFEKLATIKADVLQGLPDDFGAFLKDVPNNLLVDAWVEQNPFANARIQQLATDEIARFKSGGVQAQQGSLLTDAQRAQYG